MARRTQVTKLIQFLLILLLLSGCGGNSAGDDAATVASEPTTMAVDAAAAPDYPEPAQPLAEAPLAGIPRTPNIMVVAARQGIAELATFLHTTPETLRYVNPRLPDSVPSGTVVVIPPLYRSEGEETLAEVAEKIGLTPDLLQAANLSVAPDTEIEEGVLLAVPPLYIVLDDTPLSAAADALGTDDTALLSANPALQGDEVLAGTVLVVPPDTKEGE